MQLVDKEFGTVGAQRLIINGNLNLENRSQIVEIIFKITLVRIIFELGNLFFNRPERKPMNDFTFVDRSTRFLCQWKKILDLDLSNINICIVIKQFRATTREDKRKLQQKSNRKTMDPTTTIKFECPC